MRISTSRRNGNSILIVFAVLTPIVLGLIYSGFIDSHPMAIGLLGNQSVNSTQGNRWTYDRDIVGGLPEGANSLSGNWIIRLETDSPSPPNAICQTETAQFQALILSDTVYEDVFITTRFKTISGQTDQAAGLIFREQDSENYYLLRANVLEGNVNLYKYVAGAQIQITSSPANVTSGQWQILQVESIGNRIRGLLNGHLLIEVVDNTFKAGKIGLWTNADSITCFDNTSTIVQ